MEKLVEVKPLLVDKEKCLRDIILGFEKGQAFITALEMDLFTSLKEAKSCASLSAELGIHPGVTRKLLDMLFAMELLDRKGKLYSTADELQPFLVKGEAYFIQSLLMSIEQRNDWMKLPERLYQGPLEKPEKQFSWEYDQERVNWLARRTLLGRLQTTYKSLSAVPGFNSAKKMIDLGGAHGIFAISFAQMNPELEITIFDQAGVTKISQDFINKYEMQDRAAIITGDYTQDDIGADYDIAFSALSFAGDKKETLSFYSKVYAALNKGGLFILQTFTIDNDRKGPLFTLSSDLREYMSGVQNRHSFTEQEIIDILTESGFTTEQFVDMSEWWGMPSRMIVARK